MIWKSFIALAAGAALILAAAPVYADPVLKISGAAVVAGNIIMPNKAAIEQQSGLTLDLTLNGDANGLKDLYTGKSDAAMIAAPVKLSEAALNKAEPGSAVDASGIVVSPVGTIAIKFIVNSANPVKSLTAQQIRDILTGKITSWKDVGGNDLPILVFVEPDGFGTRSTIVESLLGGEEITPKARTVQALVQVAQVVSQAPNAFGYGNAATIKAATIKDAAMILPGIEVKQELGLGTRGAPNAQVRKLIEAVAAYGASVQ
jgi:phosphate transport system substrate-binding protein